MSSLVLPGVVDVAATPGPTATHPGLGLISFVSPEDDASSSDGFSSIGSPSSDEEEEEEEDEDQGSAHSKSTADDTTGSSSLGSLSSLEDSLPIKKGLSTHFSGKSRSFSNLSECAGGNAGDLAKEENPFNKRRRIQIASKMSYKRRASCSSLVAASLLPPLLSPEHALHEETEEEEEAAAEEENDDVNGSDDEDEDDRDTMRRRCFPPMAPNPHGSNFYHEKKKKVGKPTALKSPRSFPLFDLRYV